MAAGDYAGYGGFFGDSIPGYGDPLNLSAQVTIPADGVVPDDGGEVVTLEGSFGGEGYLVTVGGVVAYSGISGGVNRCVPSTDGGELTFVVPAGLPLGAADVAISGLDGSVTLTGALTVVRRNRRTLFYLLNRLASPRGAHPGRGPVDAADDVVLDP